MGVAPGSHIDPAWRKAMIAGLLAGQRHDGGFGVSPYSKWAGAHWRLVSLVELGLGATNRAARAACQGVLDWVVTLSEPVMLHGLERRHGSVDGNAIYTACHFGLALDRRVRVLVDNLLRAQWPDGGWNCRRDRDAHHSSFHESLAPIFGLHAYHRCTGDRQALTAARRAAELLLEHNLFRSSRTGRVIDPQWLNIHWPHYWHYDYFHGLRAVARLGLATDRRAGEAVELLRKTRGSDGAWRVRGRRYWRRGRAGTGVEVVSWGDAHQIVTPAALALLML